MGHITKDALIERLVDVVYDYGYDGATLSVISEVTGLGKASLYHLGHYLIDNPLVVQKHARHTSLTTTMRYMRRPEERLENEALDLEA